MCLKINFGGRVEEGLENKEVEGGSLVGGMFLIFFWGYCFIGWFCNWLIKFLYYFKFFGSGGLEVLRGYFFIGVFVDVLVFFWVFLGY